ncbi:MAG: hypothetical protein PHV42_02990 [Candidatus Pacebacteria bacterium]|nr:hypothetical protein [Candidatus Paceibacterota bacterium]
MTMLQLMTILALAAIATRAGESQPNDPGKTAATTLNKDGVQTDLKTTATAADQAKAQVADSKVSAQHVLIIDGSAQIIAMFQLIEKHKLTATAADLSGGKVTKLNYDVARQKLIDGKTLSANLGSEIIALDGAGGIHMNYALNDELRNRAVEVLKVPVLDAKALEHMLTMNSLPQNATNTHALIANNTPVPGNAATK